MNIIEIENVSVKIYNREIIKNLTFSLSSGDICGVIGPNGIGKSTLLKVISGIIPIKAGNILISKSDINHIPAKKMAQNIGLLPQNTSCKFPLSVLGAILLSRYPQNTGIIKTTEKEDIFIALKSLKLTKMDKLYNRCITTLSEGEKKRVLLSCIFVQNPNIFLLDEPLNFLDIDQQYNILKLFNAHIIKYNKIALIVLHDLNIINSFCNKILILDGAKNLFGKTNEILKKNKLKNLFSKNVLNNCNFK